MFMLKGLMALFLSLAIGYVLCVLAEKQKKTLRTLGYTLGISIIALSLLSGAVESCVKSCMMAKKGWMHKGMKCPAGTFMKGRIK